MLCIHGWQDNANTFCTLIPHLPSQYSYLSIDLPGHGLSSHFPNGFFYSYNENVICLRRIQNHFGWPRVSLMGHSYGANCSFLFSSYFPKEVDIFIAIDSLKPLSVNAPKEIKSVGDKIEKLLQYDSLTQESSPLYSKEDLIKRWVKGSHGSLTPETCEILINRGATKQNGLYRLLRDNRVKKSVGTYLSQDENLKLAKSIKCNVLYLKAKEAPYFENKENVLNVKKIIKENANYFEHHNLPGTHHLHLNTPEVVAPIINAFIEKVGGILQ